MEYKRLGDIASYINGYSFKPEDRGTEGLPIIRIQDLTGNAYDLGFYNGDYPERIEINDGDVLISWSASLGVYLWDRGKALLNQHIFKVVFDKCAVDKQYFIYAIQHKLKEMESKTHGATMKHIVKKDFDDTVIPFPSLEQQVEIASTLSKAANICKMHHHQLSSLDDLIKARFVEMFDLDNCKWGTFGENTDFIDYRGHTPELSRDGTIRMINAKSVGKGFFKYVDEYVTEEIYESWMHRGFGYPGDILFVTEGHTFGNTCLIPSGLNKFALGQRVITIKAHKGLLTNAFLCSYMQTDRFWKDINVYRTGGTAQGIRSKDLVKVRIPLAPIKDQKKFSAFVLQIDKSKSAIQKSLDETQLLFDSLMHQYFG